MTGFTTLTDCSAMPRIGPAPGHRVGQMIPRVIEIDRDRIGIADADDRVSGQVEKNGIPCIDLRLVARKGESAGTLLSVFWL